MAENEESFINLGIENVCKLQSFSNADSIKSPEDSFEILSVMPSISSDCDYNSNDCEVMKLLEENGNLKKVIVENNNSLKKCYDKIIQLQKEFAEKDGETQKEIEKLKTENYKQQTVVEELKQMKESKDKEFLELKKNFEKTEIALESSSISCIKIREENEKLKYNLDTNRLQILEEELENKNAEIRQLKSEIVKQKCCVDEIKEAWCTELSIKTSYKIQNKILSRGLESKMTLIDELKLELETQERTAKETLELAMKNKEDEINALKTKFATELELNRMNSFYEDNIHMMSTLLLINSESDQDSNELNVLRIQMKDSYDCPKCNYNCGNYTSLDNHIHECLSIIFPQTVEE